MKNVSDYQVGKDTGENTTQQTNRNFLIAEAKNIYVVGSILLLKLL